MVRLIVCGLFVTAFAGAARAGELDRETGPAPAGSAKANPAAAASGSELDKESPAQSHYWRRGWYGRPYGWGYSRSFYSYPAFYGYRSWYPAYYSTYWGGCGYRGWW
jgi:hypothetical protein